MSKLDEQLAALEVRLVTTRSEDLIREAVARAAQAGKSSMVNSIAETGRRDQGIDLAVRGPGGIVQQMQLGVRWSEREDGGHEVRVVVGDHLTTRPTFFLIPIGPKKAPALRSARRFVTSLEEDLATTRV